MQVAERRLVEAIECSLLAGGLDACPGDGAIGEGHTAYGDPPGGDKAFAEYFLARLFDQYVKSRGAGS